MLTLVTVAAWAVCDVGVGTEQYLRDLYESGGGQGWERKEGWLVGSACQWEGVTCSGGTVCSVSVDIHRNNVTGSLPGVGSGVDLVRLDAAYNNIEGTVPSSYGGCPATSLKLRGNRFTGEVPPALFAGSFLQSLDLSFNYLTLWGDIPTPTTVPLLSLNLSYNHIPSIPPSAAHLKSLTELILDGNPLSTTLPPQLLSLTSLSLLSIQHASLRGTLPSDLGSLSSLSRGLQLRNNSISGSVPHSIAALSRLTYLDLAFNELEGPLPTDLQGMTSLRTLLLNNNNLTGNVPHQLGLLRRVYYLDLSYNSFEGIPESLGNIAASTVMLNQNRLTGTIPFSFSNLYNVQTLLMDYNKLYGTIPPLHHLTRLETVSLRKNNLTGSLPRLPPSILEADFSNNHLTAWNTTMSHLTQLSELLIFENRITGTIPSSLCELQSLSTLDLRNNKLQGTLPPVLGTLTKLGLLYIANNHLSGTLPDLSYLGVDQDAKLTLDFHNNNFHGTIPASLRNLTNLFYLDLSINQLSGTVPAYLGRLDRLFYLELSTNALSGPLPDGLGDGSLRYFGASDNYLSGRIPFSIFFSSTLEYLSLECNALSGPVPVLGEQSALQYVNLGKNELTGRMPEGLKMSALLLHSNKIQGSVPGSISASALLLHDNHLSCPLPNLTSAPDVSIVLPSNEFTLPLPPWIVLHNADLLAVSSNPWHEYTWAWLAGGPAVITVLALFYLEKNKRLLTLVAGAFIAWIILLLVLVIVAKKKFECGRIVLSFSIAGIESDSATVMFLAVLFTVQLCVGTALVSMMVSSAPVVRRRRRGKKRSILLHPGPTPSLYRKVAAIAMFVVGTVLLCVPSATYSASHSLPPSNVFGLHKFYFSFFFTSVLVPFTVLVTVAVVVPKLSRVLLRFGWGKSDPQVLNRTVWAIRVIISFGVPIAVLLILDQGCGQMWTSLWCGCTDAGHCASLPESERNVTKTIADGLAPVLQSTAERLDYAPYSHASVMKLAESASPCFTSRKKGVCTRRVIEVLSPLLLSKLVMAAVAQPLSLIIQAYPYKQKYLKKLQKLFGGRQLSAATRLAEFEGRLVWVTWLGFAAPPILAAMLMVTCTLAGFLKRVQRWRKVVWIDVCALDALPLYSALVVAYAQAVAFWVDNEWEGTWLVGVSPVFAAVTSVLVKVKVKTTAHKVSIAADSESLRSAADEPRLVPEAPLVPPASPQWDFLGVPCYGITSLMPESQEDPRAELQGDAYTDCSESNADESLECGSLNCE